MTETIHPQVAALLEHYRRELRDTEPSDVLDARIDRLVADQGQISRPRRSSSMRHIYFWANAAGLAVLAIAAGIFIGMRLERSAPAARAAQQATTLPADFSLWPSDSVALQIPAEYSPQGTLVAVDPRTHSTGKRYWIDVVVSNDGTVRIDRIVPAPDARNKGAPDGITLQTP
jgi:CO/xanthine dehydrogenase Mo-binding subunit